MKKLIVITLLATFSGALHAQTTTGAQTTAQDLRQTDTAIGSLAAELAEKLTEHRVETVTLGQFTYMGGANQFNVYLHNQLTGELADLGGRPFSLVSGNGAPWVISGEIVHVGDFVRIYSRLVRREGGAIVSQTHTDLEMNRSVAAMLSSGGSGGGAIVMADEWETDSRETPTAYEMESGASAVPMMRTLHGGDEDWFVLEPGGASGIVVATTGETDTHITLYDADSGNELVSNDDGGDGGNASVRQFVAPGKRYLVRVKGYSSEVTGEYGFRAYTEDPGEPVSYRLGDINSSRYVMQTLGRGNDLFLLTPDSDGEMVLETTGRIDLYMELLDGETYEMLASDDDSGYDSNARIAHEVVRGRRYLARIRAYSSDEGEYGFKAYMD